MNFSLPPQISEQKARKTFKGPILCVKPKEKKCLEVWVQIVDPYFKWHHHPSRLGFFWHNTRFSITTININHKRVE